MRRVVIDGVGLHVVDTGPGVPAGRRDDAAPRPLVVLHGFLGSGEAMAPFAATSPGTGSAVSTLLGDRRSILIDLVGHGRSDAPTEVAPYLMARVVGHVAGVIDRLVAGPVDLVGYSMGGRVALSVAVERPESVGRLVLLSATAGIDDPVERAERRARDHALADACEREGMEAFVDRWEQQELFDTQRALPAETRAEIRRVRVGQRTAGIAGSLRGTGTGSMQPLWHRLADLAVPTLVVAGALDARYGALGRRLVESLGGPSRLVVVDGAGHAVHTEAPDAVLAAVASWTADA